jgi:nucleoside-diphosphate-sugar epimerase
MTVSILGCGWLGFPLALALKSNYKVKGSTTNSNKIAEIKACGIQPYLIDLGTQKTQDNIESFFDTDLLFINIPPKRRVTLHLDDYPKVIGNIISMAKQRVEKVIFISSTGVYNNDNQVVLEGDNQEPISKVGKILMTAENIVKNSGLNWIIIRSAGLIGSNRDPGKWFAGKSNIPNGLSPVNLIHLDDCIEILKRIISFEIQNDVFNLCTDSHPSRMDFYTSQSKRLGLELPQFIEEVGRYKVVSNQKIKKTLNYQFIHSDLSSLTSENF